MHRILLAVALAFGLVACGGKQQSEHHAAVDKYVNQDMLALIGVLWTGKRPLETIAVRAFDETPEWFKPPGAMDAIVIPRMTQFLDGAAKVTPPPAMAPIHTEIVRLATVYREIATDMLAAVEASDKPKFEAAHAKLMSTTEDYLAWQRQMDAALKEHGVKLQTVPKPAPLPEP